MKVTECRVNHLKNPLGFRMDSTVFSWKVENVRSNAPLTARIQIRCGGKLSVDTGWGELDSLGTKVKIDLAPCTQYEWRVCVRTGDGEEAQGEVCTFETGLTGSLWQASWIGAEESQPRHPVFSKEIIPEKKVVKARLYICGLGAYEASWNGEKIGEEYLTPYCNNYNAWLQYQTFDLTSQLQSAGTLSVLLGNGWYNSRYSVFEDPVPFYGDRKKLIAQLVLTYYDGTQSVIGTDESWQVTRSNITFSGIYDGEHWDDTLPMLPPEKPCLLPAPAGVLTSRYSTPVTAREILPVREIIHTPAGETVLDVGQIMTGIFRLAVCEPEGARIHIQFGEILQKGNFYRENLRSAKAEFLYISDGKPHILEPKFTYFGFRYVKIQGVSHLKPEDFTALVLYSDLPQTTWLTTGNAKVNQLISNVMWGQKGNFLDVPTDCPQRDERMGWTGDAQVFSPTACYLRDCYSFYQKYLHDLYTEQLEQDGRVSDMVPHFGWSRSSAAWGDAACIIPMTVYKMYGDVTILREQYASMRDWIEYIRRVDGSDCGWRRQKHFGDWLALDGETPSALRGGTDVAYIADVMYRHSVLLLFEAAQILGFSEDARKYEALAQRLLERIRNDFFTSTGECTVPTQTGLLLALMDENGPDPARYAEDLRKKLDSCGGKLQTGFVGTPMLLPMLTKYGMEQQAYDLLLNEEYPGWLYAVNLGATTIWERWNSVDENGVIAENGMNSLNHYSYGSVAQWIIESAVGISPEAPGFRKARLKPVFNRALGSVDFIFHSAAGTWEIRWKVREDGTVSYRCAVPFGCSAELSLPDGSIYHLLPGGFETIFPLKNS